MLLLLATASLTAAAATTAVEVKWDTATLRLDDTGRVLALLDNATGRNLAVPGKPLCRLQVNGDLASPTQVRRSGDRVVFSFPGGAAVVFRVSTGKGHSLWEVTSVDGVDLGRVEALRLCDLNLDGLNALGGSVNAYYSDDFGTAVMGTRVNVHGFPVGASAIGGDAKGVSHTFEPETEQVKQGRRAARFSAKSELSDASGWSVRGRLFSPPVNLTGLAAVKAWVYGDGKGEQLKVQLHDGRGGYRDDYVAIDFTGWREVTCTAPALENVALSHVTHLSFYYNGLPANSSVACLVDDVRAVLQTPQGPREVSLEDFEDEDSELWGSRGVYLRAETYSRYGVIPAGFGLVACPRKAFETSIDALEKAAGLPNPHPRGAWGKGSRLARRSYLFITGFGEKDTDEVIEWARRGGFAMILIGGGSWNRTHGHHEVNTTFFPDGLPSLQRTADRLRRAGFGVGLHFLAPAVYLNDAYVTPKPDPRLVKNAWAELAADLDEKADFVPTVQAPAGFPEEDGGYMGDGTYLQIGDELIHYAALSSQEPFGFSGCQRGAAGTTAAPHARGERVAHVQRSYGYFLFDLDSTLADEVVGNVCRVANAIKADMLYFDGSERLQDDHWYYNARLQSLYYEGLRNKDAFLQGSSYSHYSWHLISRMASADGHGDVKGYLDERLPWFASYDKNLMPLDVGWYYVYDPEVTLDQFDYILQKCLGFGASISVQTSPARLRDHPEMGPIFDLVSTYERLRVSGKVPETTRDLLRQPGREYRLLRDPLRLRRTAFEQWREITDLHGQQNQWTVEPAAEGARLGVQIRCGSLRRPGPAYRSPEALTLETFDDLAPYLSDPNNQFDVFVIGPGKAGSVREGVTQEFASVEEGAVEGRRCGRYTATSSLPDTSGWSSIGKRFDPPLDLSAHRGIGFWLRGDGRGGQFKLQLRQGPNATDYYITNDFTDWRYFQLLRPTKPQPLPIDYSRVEYLIFYYNGLPSRTTVTCWIDDVKVLDELDDAGLVEPELRVGERRVVFPVTLREGERLVYFPGEAPEVLPATRGEGPEGERRRLPPVEDLPLAGEQPVVFTCREPMMVLARVRTVQDCPEELPLPEEALRAKLD